VVARCGPAVVATTGEQGCRRDRLGALVAVYL